MDSYRAEKKAAMAIQLPDHDVEIGLVDGGGHKPEPELGLSNILKGFNEQFGTIFHRWRQNHPADS